MPGGVLELAALREAFAIEDAAPGFITTAGDADSDQASSRKSAQGSRQFPLAADRIASIWIVHHLHGERLALHDRWPYPLIRIHPCDVFRLGHRVTARQNASYECQQNDIPHGSLLR